ncbi:hypothetical protein LZ554_006268 [Drepanopeziza brunnea f. sp. 'monogermtubi']|nr:hypothetical protein LZ554_006268 [Drepanopeziza brunnea f. sp. 'monogermtubi']
MASQLVQVMGHLPTLLPDGPVEDPYSELNWATLLAIMDTVVPSIQRETTGSGSRSECLNQRTISAAEYQETFGHLQETMIDAPDSNVLAAYLHERPSEMPSFRDLLRRTMSIYVPEDGRNGLRMVLATLNSRLGCLLLTGYPTSFREQPIHIREQILCRWRDSYLPQLNVVFKQMTALAKSIWLKTSPTYSALSGFPSVPDHSKPESPHDYRFLQFPPGSEPATIQTDVIIVGSGCGGAVCAKNLAEAGHRVMVVDKGYHFPPSQLPMTDEAGGVHLYEGGGAATSDDKSMNIIAGATWGGGGTINWSASLQTQGFVRREWAQDRGLAFFETAEFQSCLDRVCERMGVSAAHVRHNHGNRVLVEGARKLGYHAEPVPQNTGGREHYCGHCTMGCGSGQKQGPVTSWLPDAANAGAEFVEGFMVDRVIFDEEGEVKTALGVRGKWVSRNEKGGVDGPESEKIVREVILRAKKVIVSCGSLWSPVVLLNSGLKNPQIGKNLYLHPTNTINAVFREDIRPWEGGILTSVCTTFENLDLKGHGVKLEATAMLPSLNLVLLPWTSGAAYKSLALKFRRMNGYISIARDRDPGLVYRDPTSGQPRIKYTPSAFDRANIMEGVIAMCKIAYVQGATEIHLMHSSVAPFIKPTTTTTPTDAETAKAHHPPSVTDVPFASWLAEVHRLGNRPPAAAFASAHQMGSNRMSASPAAGVVDPKGRVWGTEGLYVADASVFPSASGVNPMVTNMAICDYISRGICEELKAGM